MNGTGPISANYEDTLKSLRTGKSEPSSLGNLKKYMTWGRNDNVLPFTTPNAQRSSWASWTGVANAPLPFYETFGLTTMQRYVAFGLCIAGATLLMLLAMMQLPLIVFRPSKFIVPYCMSSMLVFISFGFLHGFGSYCRHLFSSGKWPYTAAFLGTTVATLYAAIAIRMFALTVPLAVVQFIAMVAYMISYIPGGSSGLSVMGTVLGSSIRSHVSSGF